MALDFPASPSNGDTYAAPNGVLYTYDAAAGLWYVGAAGSINTTDIVDGAVTGPKLASDIEITTTGGITTTGDINANNIPTSGRIVGYQQGIWLPDFASDANVSSWITKGLTQNASGGDTSHLVGEFAATFSRIGQMVTLQAHIRFDPTSGTAADGGALAWTGLPYAPSVTNQRIITNPGFSTNVGYIGSTYFSGNTAYVSSSTYPCFQAYIYTSNPFIVALTKNGPTVSANSVRPNDFGSAGTQYHMMTISYRTDDTTWVPVTDRTSGVV